MKKEEKQKELNKKLKEMRSSIIGIETELNKLNNQIEIYRKDLIKAYEFEDKEILTVKRGQGSYEFILGGDGRSMPWSEMRTGAVVNIEINPKYFIPESDLSNFRSYVSSVEHANCIKIKTE